jgi:glycosyltransferase involved in cell wall biosynthesis
LADAATGLHVVLAGTVEVGYAEELDRLVGVMRAGGATVIVRAGAHTEIEGLRLLARARCAALPYHRHSGMSRVLLESANVETPVLVHDHGLVAALVRQHAIGVVLDCGESRAFREALRALCADGEVERYRPALRAFARRYEDAAFSRALRAPFGLRPQPAAALGEATR